MGSRWYLTNEPFRGQARSPTNWRTWRRSCPLRCWPLLGSLTPPSLTHSNTPHGSYFHSRVLLLHCHYYYHHLRTHWTRESWTLQCTAGKLVVSRLIGWPESRHQPSGPRGGKDPTIPPSHLCVSVFGTPIQSTRNPFPFSPSFFLTPL